MGTNFLAGTPLYPYECMMKQVPSATRDEHEAEKEKKKLVSIMKDYLKNNGLKVVEKRVLSAMDKLVYEEFVFLTETHKDMFYYHFCKNSKDRMITPDDAATMYLLCISPVFSKLLNEFRVKKEFRIPNKIQDITGECEYNIFHAVRMINGMKSKMQREDLFEKEIIDDRILCIIFHAYLIKEYGFPECTDKKEIRKMIRGRQINDTYEYKGQKVKIK